MKTLEKYQNLWEREHNALLYKCFKAYLHGGHVNPFLTSLTMYPPTGLPPFWKSCVNLSLSLCTEIFVVLKCCWEQLSPPWNTLLNEGSKQVENHLNSWHLPHTTHPNLEGYLWHPPDITGKGICSYQSSAFLTKIKFNYIKWITYMWQNSQHMFLVCE